MLGHHWKWFWPSVSFYGVSAGARGAGWVFWGAESLLWSRRWRRWACAGCCRWGCAQPEPVLPRLCPAQPCLSHTGHFWLHHNQSPSCKEQSFATSSRAAKNSSGRKCLGNSNGQLGLCESETPALVDHKSDLYFHRIWATSRSPDLWVSILLSRDIQHGLSVLQ